MAAATLPACNVSDASLACFLHDAHTCNSSSLDWTYICSLSYSTNWHCCGLERFDVESVTVLWTFFFVLAAIFSWYSNMLHEFKTSVHDLHDIPTQALGVVVARQKKEVMGRMIDDPRRLWIILSVLIELGVFSYVPVQLIMYDQSDSYSLVVGWEYQIAKFGLFGIALVLDLTHAQCTNRVLQKFVLPLAYDTGYTTLLYAIVDLGTCSNHMDALRFADGSTCASPDRYYWFALVATVSFAVLFWRTLLYKMHFSDQVYAVRFRFQTSYYSLMTFCRTACCLSFITIQKLILYVDHKKVYMGTGVANFTMFYLLFRYNYNHQPCLGVGLLLNNLRSLSFATACYFSAYLVLLSIIHMAVDAPAADKAGGVLWILSWVVVAFYPFFGTTVWYFNQLRAQQFEIPNMSLEAALVHKIDRVRAVAAVSLTLEDQSTWTVAYKSRLVYKLHDNLNLARHSEQGMALVYTCQAMWTLWCKYFTMDDVVLEGKGCLPCGLWERAAKSKELQRLHLEKTAANKLVGKFDSLKPSSAPPLTQLVEDTMTTQVGVKRCRLEAWSTADDPVADVYFKKIVVVLAEMARSPYTKTRYAASKTLHDMYTSDVVQLTDATMIHALCTLCGSHEHHLSGPAARTLCKLYTLHWKPMEWSKVHLAERLNLLNLAKFVSEYGPVDRVLMGGIAHVLLDCTQWVASKAGREDPSMHYCDKFIAFILAAQATVEARVTAALYFVFDDILLHVHLTCEHYLRRLHTLRVIRTAISKVKVVPSGLGKSASKSKGVVTGPSTGDTPASILPHATSAKPLPSHGTSTVLPRRISREEMRKSLKRYSWTVVTKMATKAKRLALVTPHVAEAVQKRFELRRSMASAVRILVNEGFYKDLPPTAMQPATYQALLQAAALFRRQPLIFDVVLAPFTEAQVVYVTKLFNTKLRHNAQRRWS
ncbi:Aste57867_22523 [Aphanomyces stellatus]|uniref:Aste57867_22523 protein n=1 Tax=Aphanomyces stellatus TaxID=120398 RepID=A0A485LKC1_9STRA|nr:hypothetical protein As57867_022453 [Aphanomyces stellatus]VFT99183.1 Aste57867_22523 [Aphanomyces stellatus]